MSKWLNQHQQALGLVLSRLKKQWLSTLLICAVIGVTLAIPSLIYVVVHNVNDLISDIKKDSQISVFLKQEIDQPSIDSIADQLKTNSTIKKFTFVSKEDALKQLVENSKNPEITSTLETNPLPHAFFIEPQSITPEAIHTLQQQLQSINGVQEVIIDSAWINRLNSLLKIGYQAVWILGCLLSFALVAVISNTIRMQILTHKEEIEVSELFGATKSFIRRPFLYLGTLYGFGGGLFACLILWLVTSTFNQTVVKLASEYLSDFSLQFNQSSIFISMFCIATLIGWLASYLAVSLKSSVSNI